MLEEVSCCPSCPREELRLEDTEDDVLELELDDVETDETLREDSDEAELVVSELETEEI